MEISSFFFSYRKLNDDFVRRNIIFTSVSFIFNIENFILLQEYFVFLSILKIAFVILIRSFICPYGNLNFRFGKVFGLEDI